MAEFDLLRAQKRVFRSSLRALERLVVLAILDHWSTKSRKPFPSLATLQDCTGLGRRAVIDAIKGLAAAGAVRVECRRPVRTVDGRHEVVPNAKPTNHYDLSGLMTLPVREAHQCASDTSALDAPVREGTPTSAPEAPELVREGISKEPRKEPKKEPTHVFVLQPSSPREDLTDLVLKHWIETLWSKHHDRQPKLTPKRRTPIKARLRDGYSVAQLKQVIDAVAGSEWHNGTNDRGKIYIEPETIFRDAGKVDGWLATKAPRKSRQQRHDPQQNGTNPFEGCQELTA